jgi:hypothetical protein
MPLRDLRAGYDSLYRELEGKPSRYAAALAPEKPTEINDELSEHSAPPAKTLLDKLREQLAACKSTNDCTSWAAAVFQMDVSLEDRLKLSNEWHARVQEIASAEDPLEIPAALRRKTNGEFVNPLAAG